MEGRLRGRVSAFDEAVGLGTVTGDDGREYPFHCTQIADGTRTIAVGAAVVFRPWPHLGRWEASDIAVVGEGGASGPGGSDERSPGD